MTLEEPYELAALLDRLSASNSNAVYNADQSSRDQLGQELQQPMHSEVRWCPTEARMPVVLVDCLTLWLSNWLLTEENDPKSQATAAKMKELVDAAARFDGTLLMVTNEVGSGIVPEYRLGRQFRDLAGQLNRQLAAVSDQVFLVAAGIPLEIKSRAFTFD